MKTAKSSAPNRALLILVAFGAFASVCLYAMIGNGRATHRVEAEETDLQVSTDGAPLMAGADSGQVLTSTEVYTAFLPLTMRETGTLILLSGQVYHDLNGNGTHDTAFSQGDHTDNPDGYIGSIGPIQEPPIAGVVIRAGGAEDVTDSEGRYALCLSAGDYAVSVESSSHRFRFPSASELKDISEPIAVALSAATTLDIGLGVGPLTIPYRLGEADIFRQGSFVDIDPVYDEVGIYRSYPEDCYWWHCSGDAHRGIDLHAPEGTLVVAAAPGLVYDVDVRPGLTMVFLAHTDYEDLRPVLSRDSAQQGIAGFPNQGFGTSYQHLASVADGIVEGAFVPRGHPIGYLNQDVHLHFDSQWFFDGSPCTYRCYVDLYRDLFHDEFAWMEHDSRYGYSIWISWGSPGWWTADNLPHFANE